MLHQKIKVMKWMASFILAVLFTLPSKSTMTFFKANESAPVITDTVTVTTYTTDPQETDEEPLITASGFKLDSLNPRRHKIIAVSRDLKKLFKFGQKVKITGIGKYSGIYVVRDLMNKRWKKRVDILINPEDKQILYYKAKLSKA
jgi:3D (Asp-Asp-Asp) domain-containing protein